MQIIKFLLLRFFGLSPLNLLYQADLATGSEHRIRWHTQPEVPIYDQIRKKSRPFYMPSHSQLSFLLQKGMADQDSAILQYLPVSLKSYARFTQNLSYVILLVEMTCNNKNAIRYQGNLMLQLPIKHFLQTVLIQTCIPHFVGSKNNNLLSLTHFHALVNICLHLFINGHDKLNNFMSTYVIQYGNYIDTQLITLIKRETLIFHTPDKTPFG